MLTDLYFSQIFNKLITLTLTICYWFVYHTDETGLKIVIKVSQYVGKIRAYEDGFSIDFYRKKNIDFVSSYGGMIKVF